MNFEFKALRNLRSKILRSRPQRISTRFEEIGAAGLLPPESLNLLSSKFMFEISCLRQFLPLEDMLPSSTILPSGRYVTGSPSASYLGLGDSDSKHVLPPGGEIEIQAQNMSCAPRSHKSRTCFGFSQTPQEVKIGTCFASGEDPDPKHQHGAR